MKKKKLITYELLSGTPEKTLAYIECYSQKDITLAKALATKLGLTIKVFKPTPHGNKV